MPIDQRRINGPDTSIPYNTYLEASLNDNEPVYDHMQNRKDGRAHDELRKMFVKTEIITQAKGSAYIEMGDTKVICSVFDPREVPSKNGYGIQGELFCEFKFAPFSCNKRKIHQQDAEEKEYSLILQRALEPAVCLHEFPNFQVDVYAIVLDNGGSSLAAAIMAASLALANAGVPMFGLVTATTMAIHGNKYLLDPTDIEESFCNTSRSTPSKPLNHGIIMQATLPQHGQVSEFFAVGSLNTDSVTNAIEILTDANKSICPVLQQCLVKSIIKTFKRTNQECLK